MPTNPSSPESLTLETLLDELNRATNRVAQWRYENWGVSLYELQEKKRSSREAVTKYMAKEIGDWEAVARVHAQAANDESAENDRLRSRIAELEKRDKAFGYRREEFR